MSFINKFVILCVAVQALLVSNSLVQAQVFSMDSLGQVAQSVRDNGISSAVSGANSAAGQALDTGATGVDMAGSQLGGTQTAGLVRGLAADEMEMMRREMAALNSGFSSAMRGINSISSVSDINRSNAMGFGQDVIRVTSEAGQSLLEPVSSMMNRVRNFGFGRQ